MMAFSRSIRIVLGLALGAAFALSAGCSHAPKPDIGDFDTYQVINIGEVKYITPNGLRAVDSGPGYVEHEIEDIPEALLRVEIETEPPRRLGFDADQRTRQFLREVPKSQLTNVQYDRRDGRHYLKMLSKGEAENGLPLYAEMSLIRDDNETILFKIVGPMEDQPEMSRLLERLSEAVVFQAP